MIETVLSIAGSDPTGGAGIQADLKTMTAVGVYGAAAITCITVQNSLGVSRVEPLHPVLVGEQIEAVLRDHRVAAIKIGMIGTAGIAKVIGVKLAGFPGEVVYDPVLVSTTGHELTDRDALAEVRTSLVSRATVLTPNLPELETLTGIAVEDESDIRQSVQVLLDENQHLRCVLVTGGHGAEPETLTDYLFQRSEGAAGMETISHPRIRSDNTHGTGCTLASAFASCLALSYGDHKAFGRSVGLLCTLIERSASARIVNNPKGKGGLLHHLGRR